MSKQGNEQNFIQYTTVHCNGSLKNLPVKIIILVMIQLHVYRWNIELPTVCVCVCVCVYCECAVFLRGLRGGRTYTRKSQEQPLSNEDLKVTYLPYY